MTPIRVCSRYLWLLSALDLRLSFKQEFRQRGFTIHINGETEKRGKSHADRSMRIMRLGIITILVMSYDILVYNGDCCGKLRGLI
jgi:hypothetical protein